MKKYLLLFLFTFSVVLAYSQEELHIHHINVEDGDATMIGIYDTSTHQYKSTILIDGGNANPNDLLLPYLKSVTGSAAPHFNYVALTHYHKDHYNGLTALNNGRITTDSIIDPAGYDFHAVFPSQPSITVTENKPAALSIAAPWISALSTAVAHGFVKGHATGFVSFGTSANTSLGHRITLGTAGGLPVVLECVAGWGNTLNGQGITPDPAPGKDNGNDFTLSFVLTCGQFRYFIGGDLGGSNNGDYIDQESPLTAELAAQFPETWSYNHITKSSGHICGFKANHHGSNNSNTQSFMDAMTPAITVTSAGHQTSWHLPHPAYLSRLAKVKPLSVWTASSNNVSNRGVYITNVYDFTGFPSKTNAIELFNNKPFVSFSYGNLAAGQKSGYLVKVTTTDLEHKSGFQVYRTDNAGASQILLANYLCHSK